MRAATFSIRRARRTLQTSSFSSAASSSSGFHTAAYVAVGGGAAAAVVAAYNGVVPHEWVIRQLAEPMMPVVRMFEPETAHKIAVQCARFGLTPKDPETDPELLHVQVLGLEFTNPLGIAAGFDKDGEAMEGMLDMGFGCVEIGSVTPKAQPGNPTPRVFRLPEDRGVINRYGFNSKGLEHVGARLERYVSSRVNRQDDGHRAGVLGVNLGKNKLTEDAAADYVQGVHALGKYADYLVVNVSSPNTPGLRTLQGKIQLQKLLEHVLKARDEVADTEKRTISLLVKIAPDLTEDDKQDIADVALALKLDGLVVSNTTLSRPDTLKGAAKGETGGLSGFPVRDMSTKVLGDMYKLTKGKIPLIGVGGVSTGQDAYDKIRAGASLVQMYSCLIYESPLAVPRAKKELAALLSRDGYKSVIDAVGAAHK
ncbi:dihydroorotate dehydrogenase, mitochondrial precursor [Phytophthora infestans T30-4]|uniref:Dihydroorotate dehydrogenase (quinone), mitochondrial n=2 Tax=Phytophthora infestans TaxID=4787 RepID=D0MUE3_PHYIT|nr:dihydroorotate dehydrogenase, mitochondrial precursor [Phytophthora infestans T30-4]AFP19903.1 mitochondrial dihydroorotate dehydrogenase [Phytophthora infestans]EEY61590.1 dihydroorotate dehydrogenase, mitochondrial precursor [Phytophthora infestans T30-4]|eukprot:XP_002908507.1 dihydroorotate dehydrogenase, mitochondrial precursor [Phytophthora infestans T30-4]